MHPAYHALTLTVTSSLVLALSGGTAPLQGPATPAAPTIASLAAARMNREAEGFIMKARETGDAGHYDRALALLAQALATDPGNESAVINEAWARLGRHEFAEARRIARGHLARRADDTRALGLLGDAAMELGSYDEAGVAYQRMIDIEPGPASYSRGSHLREVTGDLPGALELMRLAARSGGPPDGEGAAWFMVQTGHLQEAMGDIEASESSYRDALRVHPGYHYALAALAGTALKRGRPMEAERFARQVLATVPHAERYLLLADALHAQGRHEEAEQAEGKFESMAQDNSRLPDNENHDLVLYYIDRRPDPPRALAIAEREAAVRRDVHTLDRFAMALHANRRHEEAARLMRRILSVGTRDPQIWRHAKVILGAGTQEGPDATQDTGRNASSQAPACATETREVPDTRPVGGHLSGGPIR